MSNISIEDIAAKAGVSTATVSRAFSKKSYIKKETRDLIMQISKELNYKPKIYNKRTVESVYRSTIGVILPYFNNDFYYEIVKGIENTLSEYDIDVLFCCTFSNPRKEMMYLDLFHRIKPNGIIIVPCSEKAEDNKQYLRDIANELNVIILDRELKGEDYDGVFMNNFESAYTGTKILINEGHQQITFVCGSLESSSGYERLLGYKKALQDAQIPYDENNVIYGNFEYQTTYEQTKAYLSKKHNSTAFFSSSNTMAYACMLALSEAGLSIPSDISFLTYGYSNMNDKNISCLRYPGIAMGKECANIMLERIQDFKHKKKSARKRSIFEVIPFLNGSEKHSSALL